MQASLLLWQLADSGFPAGGFAHSGGLEAAVHHGLVHDDETLWRFARHAVAQSGRSALPLVAAAHRHVEDLAELDRLSDAFLISPTSNHASRSQGRAFLTSAARSFPEAGLSALEERVRESRLAGHHAPIFGAALRTLGVETEETQRLFLFTAGRGIGAAAVRLGIVGAYESQRLQRAIAEEIDAIVRRCSTLGPLDIAQTAPLIDLCQSTHERLYSRLFQS